MIRPAVEVADILRAQGNSFLDHYRGQLRFQQLKVMRAILRCRTAALGGHVDKCLRCDKDWSLSFNSCRNRHCPKCQAQSRQRWIAARQEELLATSYFHVVFTLPHLLNTLIRQNPIELYNLLFRSSYTGTNGWSMPNLPLAALNRFSVTSGATPIVWPSPIIV